MNLKPSCGRALLIIARIAVSIIARIVLLVQSFSSRENNNLHRATRVGRCCRGALLSSHRREHFLLASSLPLAHSVRMGAFALTIFTGAFLLFQVQPLIGKYILPWFGGSPGVWTTCMLFFQVLLLGGYAYAHLLTRWFRPRTQAIIHLLLLVAALAMLPIIPSDSWKPSGAANPMLRILALLTVSLGLPYFVLSSTGPLMQQWFSQTHPGRSPYRLFALSNTGSLLALVSYPFLFEPTLTRTVQARAWGWGLAVFAVCCGFCALKLFKAKVGINATSLADAPPGDAASVLTSGRSRLPRLTPLLWLALPACASVLLLATTNKLCQDVAVIPFLWVLPLGMYLLSFIICFDNPRWYARLPFAIALVVMLGALCWALPHSRETSLFLLLPLYGGGLFVCCMVCHGELYRLKPDPARLTLFYLMIAAGGALGGAFVAILAPLIFNDYYELHLGLFLCGLLFLLSCVFQKGQVGTSAMSWSSLPVVSGSLGLLALAAALWFQAHHGLSTAISQSRNFYGVLTVHEYDKDDPQAHQFQLLHGATLHGIQFADPLLSLRRTAYYTERSGAGLALRSFPAGHRRIGLVGLGVGTLASYAEPGDYVRIYEINPEVQRLASSKFTYLSDCLGRLEVILGDARLSLEVEPPQNFDVLALDAFSSDAIPVHLLTKEAFAVYERHLKTNGIIAIHISNTTLDLEPVVLQLAQRYKYASAIVIDSTVKPGTLPSRWILLSPSAEIINSPSIDEASRPPQGNWQRGPLWTDDFTSLFQILGAPEPPPMKADPADDHYHSGVKLYSQGDHAGALGEYRLAIRSEPDLPEALNDMAWLLATTPDDSLRNGAEAVRVGERTCALTRYRVPVMIGTLAAAYAEAGRFDDAIATAQKACALSSKYGQPAVLANNQQLMQLYAAHQPYREIRKLKTGQPAQ